MNPKFEYDFTTVRKLGAMARDLPENIDFLDYWYHFFLSETKYKIESDILNNINAFHWTRWQEDFEEFVDGYTPREGEGFDSEVRHWFAMYMQYLVYAFNLPGRDIAGHYGKPLFVHVMDEWFRYHTFGVDLFVDHIILKFGLPPGVQAAIPLNM